MLDFPKKIGFVGGEQVNSSLHLVRMRTAAKQRHVVAKAVQLKMRKTLAQASHDQRSFGTRQADACRLVNEALKLRQLNVADSVHACPCARRSSEFCRVCPMVAISWMDIT